MKAKDTVMSSEKWDDIYSKWLEYPGGTAGDLANKMNEAQAEISFKVGKTAGVVESLIPALKAIEASRKAGRKEVIELLYEGCDCPRNNKHSQLPPIKRHECWKCMIKLKSGGYDG